MNISNEADDKHWYPLPFRVLATSLYVFFMVIGLVGNSLVITVVFRVRGMRTPTNCYLVSLAFSDCLFFLSAMPRELMALHQPQGVYRFGEVACVILTYLPYLAINASSLSITAFTVERYIAICKPMKAKSMCTVRRAVVIIALIWVFSLLWNASWLYLATLEPHPRFPHRYRCSFRIDRDSASYKIVYLVDFVSFYLIPLLLYLILYGRIAYILMNSTNKCSAPYTPNPNSPIPDHHSSKFEAINTTSTAHDRYSNLHDATVEFKRGRRYTKLLASSVPIQDGKKREPMQRESRMYGAAALKGRAQVVKMLVVIVVVFAMCWLPYRALVFYNSFASQAWVNEWFLLVAKIMIVINCAINPILYNLMSAKFRAAFHFFLKGCCTSKQERIRSHSSYRAHNQNMTLRAVNTPSPTGGRVEKQARVSKFVYGSQKARRGHPVTLKKTNSMPPPVE